MHHGEIQERVLKKDGWRLKMFIRRYGSGRSLLLILFFCGVAPAGFWFSDSYSAQVAHDLMVVRRQHHHLSRTSVIKTIKFSQAILYHVPAFHTYGGS